MLFRYQDKEIRVTTEDGSVFTGIAEFFSSGYGLHEYGREEEGIQLGDVILFKSDIRSIEELPETASEATDLCSPGLRRFFPAAMTSTSLAAKKRASSSTKWSCSNRISKASRM